MREDENGPEAFVGATSGQLMRLADVLTSQHADAEDLVQRTLERVVRRWAAVNRSEDPTVYARRMLVNQFIDAHRRRLRGPKLVYTHALQMHAASDVARADDRDLRRTMLS